MVLRAGIERVINDDLARDEHAGKLSTVHRDSEVDQVIDTLVRIKGSNPVLVGEAGVGKTAIVDLLRQRLRKGDLPVGSAYDSLRNAIVVQTTAGKISSLAKSNDAPSQQAAMEDFLKGLKRKQKKN